MAVAYCPHPAGAGALGIAGTLFWLSTAPGQNYAQNLVKTQLSEAAGYAITAEGLHFTFPLNATIHHLTLADSDGVWLDAADVAFSVLPTPAMLHSLTLRRLNAASLKLLRLPLATAKEKQEHKSGGIDVSILSVNLAQVTLPAAITSLPEAYDGSLSGSLGWSARSETLTLDLTTAMQHGIPGLETAELSAKAAINTGKDTIRLTAITLKHPAVTASGDVNLDQNSGALKATLSATIADLAKFSPGATGAAQIGVALSGTVAAPHAEISLAATNLRYADKDLPNLTTQISAGMQDGAAAGTFSASTADDGGLTTRFRYAAPTLTLENLTASYLGASLTADAALNTQSRLATGTAHVAVPELQSLARFLPEGFAGKLEATIALSAPAAAQAAKVTFAAASLRTPYATVARATGEASFADVTQGLPDTLNLKADNITRDAITLSRTSLSARRADALWHAELATQGSLPQSFTTAATADITQAASGYAITLPSLKGNFDGHNFRSLSPVTASIGDHNDHLTAPRFTYGQGQYTLDAALDGTQVKAALTGSNIAASDLMEKPAHELASARATLSLAMSGEAASPDTTANLTVTQLVLAPKAPPATLKGAASLKQDTAKIDATLLQGKAATSQLSAALPVRFSLQPFAFAIAGTAPLSGKASLAMDVTSLAQAFLPPPHALSGKLKADLTLGGTYASPAIAGPIAFTGGKYTYPDLGITLDSLSAHATAQNTALTLNDFTASDGKNHTLSGKGSASFASAAALKYAAHFTAQNFLLLRHPNARAVLSADIALSGDAKSGLVKGTLTNEQTDINLPDRVVGEIPQLNIIRSVPAKKSDKLKPAKPAPAYPLMLDVSFRADNKVFVRGRGVDAEMKGDLAIQGQAAKPDITGKLSTVRGRYEQFGKQFTLTTAELTFLGDIPPSPFLNIVASIKVGENEIEPTITGPLLKPDLKIQSTPAMSQEEALSLLLFGQGSKKLSAFQAVQLANSLRELSGHGGSGFDPIGKIRKLIGVDDITIKNDDNNPDPSVGVGKYIGDKVYLQVEQGAGQASSKASVEVEVTPGISVESGTAATGASSVGLNWKHDY